MQRTQPYPDRPGAWACLQENPARYLHPEASNDLTRHAILRGMDSLQRLAWWHRVAQEEGYNVDAIEARRDQLLAGDEREAGAQESTPASEADERVEEAVAAIEAADSVSAVERLQDEELQRDEPAKRVIGAANKRLDELRSECEQESDPEPEPDEAAANTATCPFCEYDGPTEAFFDARACPGCDAALDDILDSGTVSESESQEVAA